MIALPTPPPLHLKSLPIHLVHKALHLLLQMLQIVIFSPERFLTVTRAFKHIRRRNRFGKKCFR